MNKICREYILEIKALFPIKRKPEREYIKKLVSDIEDYCEEENVTSKQELYENYGKPNEIVNNYFSAVDTEYIAKQIRVTGFIKTAVAVLLVLATVATSALCIYLNSAYQVLAREEIVIRENIITEK